MITMNQTLQIEIGVPKKTSLIQTLQIERGLLKTTLILTLHIRIYKTTLIHTQQTGTRVYKNNSDSDTINRDSCPHKQL